MDDANLFFVVDHGNQPVVVSPDIKNGKVSRRVHRTKRLSKVQHIPESTTTDETLPSLQRAFRIRVGGAKGFDFIRPCQRHSFIYSRLL